MTVDLSGVEWIFFDMGSTLVDEGRAYEHRLEDAVAGTDISYDEAYGRVAEIAKRGNAEPIKEFAKEMGLTLTPWHLEDEFAYPQAKECLMKLGEKYKIGIIANQPLGAVERLKGYGLYEYVDLVISSAEEKVEKPDLKIFLLALERAECLPQNAVMVGDRIDNDIAPAKAVGMRTVWVRQGFGGMAQNIKENERPDMTADDIGEVCERLVRSGSK